MKNTFYLLSFIAFILMTGCSSSDDTETPNLSTENSFTVTIDDVVYAFDTFFAFKTHDNFEVLGTNSNQENFYLRFNENGVLDRANFYITDGTLDVNYNSAFYSPDFSLSNLTIDMSQNIVNANFSGNIYKDDIDVLNSSVMEVQSGSFNLIYTINEVDPLLDEFIDATVNGSLYESIKHGRSGGAAGSTIYQLFGISDNNIVISVDVDAALLEEGTFDFTDSSVINRVSVEYVDPFSESNSYEELSATGTLVIDSIIEGGLFNLIQGTFSVTANGEDNQVYTIENGSFNLSI